MGDRFGNAVALLGAMAAVGLCPEAATSGVAELIACGEATGAGSTLTAIVC